MIRRSSSVMSSANVGRGALSLNTKVAIPEVYERRECSSARSERSDRGLARRRPVIHDAPLPWSAEREHEGLDAAVRELDLEQAVVDRWWLTDQLIHPLIVRGAVAVLVDVDTVCGAGGRAVDSDAERH